MNRVLTLILTGILLGTLTFQLAGEEPAASLATTEAAPPSGTDAASELTPTPDDPASSSGTKAEAESQAASPAATPAAEAAAAKETPTTAAPVPVEYRPYRIRVSVAFESDPAVTRRFAEQIRERMAALFARSFGLTCELDTGKIESADWLSPGDFSSLERLSEAEIRSRLNGDAVDKQFVLVIRQSGPRFEMACREWDASLRELASVANDVTWDRREVADTAVALISRLFRPNYTVEDVDPLGKIARLKVRAGGMPLGRDPGTTLVNAGDVLLPFFRYYDRNRELQRIQVAPWSYLVVNGVDGPTATCSIVSGLRGALGTGQRRRVEAAAIRAQPMYAETRVNLVLFSNRSKPLAGHQVLITRKSPLKMSEAVEPTQAVTDRDGGVTLTRDDTLPLLWLAVRSGDTLLARVPLVPGLTREATLDLPDDALRLSVERDLDMLKGRLVAVVAQRATLISRALALGRAGDGPNALKILAETERLPKIADFDSQLNAIRVPAVEAAQKKRDRVSESRINKLCTNASDLIRNYLAEDKLRVVQEEIRQLADLDKPDEKSNQKGAPRGAGGRK